MRFFVAFLFLFFCFRSYAWEAGLGFYKKDELVQNSSGDEAYDPYHFMFMLGHTFNLTPTIVFSPYFGYIKHNTNHNDNYGGDYEVKTWALIYDFLWAPQMNVSGGYAIRYGFSNFIKKIKGKGGAVTVPNGSGYDTAYRPDEERASYTMALDLGGEFFFGPVTQYLKATGIRGEIFFFHPLNKEKRNYAFNFMWIGYFQ